MMLLLLLLQHDASSDHRNFLNARPDFSEMSEKSNPHS